MDSQAARQMIAESRWAHLLDRAPAIEPATPPEEKPPKPRSRKRPRKASPAKLAEAGDVHGLLQFIRSRPHDLWADDTMAVLAKAVRTMGARNVGQLTGVALGEVISFTFTMWCRAALHVEKRLAQWDQQATDKTSLPDDLEAGGWFARLERIAKFLTEVATLQTRVIHFSALYEKSTRKPQPATVVPPSRPAVVPSPPNARRTPPPPDPAVLSVPTERFTGFP